MDPLSWFLLLWVVISAAIFFFVQTILPNFLPPIDSAQRGSSCTEAKSNIDQSESDKPTPTLTREPADQPFAALSSWAASTLGVNVEQLRIGETCDWVNDALSWLHKSVRHSPVLSNGWLRAMNDASSKLAATLGCDVYYEEVIPGSEKDGQGGPKLSAIRSEFGPREHLTMRAKLVYPRMGVRLVASQKLPDRLLVSNYLAVLKDLTGQAHLRIACIGEDLFFMGCFEGKPDATITFENGDQAVEQRVDTKLVEEVIRKCLASAVTNVSLAKLREQPLVKRVVVNGLEAVNVSPAELRQCQAITAQDRLRSNRLLLKVEKASQLGGGNVPSQPYVVIEVDEPAQKHTTTIGFKDNPCWEEQFLFDLNEKSEEVLFEVYDRQTQPMGAAPIATEEGPRFLGLAIVGVDELRQSDKTIHTLTLQARPYNDDLVSGTLTAEFIFLREQLTETRGGKRTERADVDNQHLRPLHVLTDFHPTTGGVKTAMDSPYIDEAREMPAERRLPSKVRGTSSYSSAITGVSSLSSNRAHSPTAQSVDRGRKKERSFFGDLKRRLAFRKGAVSRARSLEPDVNGGAGLDTSTAGQHGRSASTPVSRDASRMRKRANDHTPLTSDSEMSVTSTDSVYAQSQLVVETVENGAKRYYYLPTPAQRHTVGKRLMKSGKKLHLYNEHTFSAVKTRAGSTCSVCNAVIATAFRRKGYQCRDCGLVCHKRCHFKTIERCPFSKVATIPIEIIKIT